MNQRTLLRVKSLAAYVPRVLIKPIPPPYDPLVWAKQPFPEKARLVCNAWAMQGYGTPLAVYLVYALKVAAFVGAWVFWCGFSPGMGTLATIREWALTPLAFQKVIVWSLLFEILGLGCGSGPLTGRYVPPIGGVLYFLRPGTTKLPVFAALGHRRTLLDLLGELSARAEIHHHAHPCFLGEEGVELVQGQGQV